MRQILSTRTTLIAFAILLAVGALFFAAPPMEGGHAFAIAYVIAVSIFLGAQLYGFVLSQVDVDREIERPKLDMLENEVAEWSEAGQ